MIAVFGHSIEPEELVNYTFKLLQLDLEMESITNKRAYSYVDKMIIIAHGEYTHLVFAPDDNGSNLQLSIKYIKDNIFPTCKINLLDIQACHCGRPDYYSENGDEGYSCVAYEFARKEQIETVYAWTSECAYLFDRYNCSVKGGSYQIYYVYCGELIHYTVDTDVFLDSMPVYVPLQY